MNTITTPISEAHQEDQFRMDRSGVTDQFIFSSQAGETINGTVADFIYEPERNHHLAVRYTANRPVISVGNKILRIEPDNEAVCDLVEAANADFCEVADYISSCYGIFHQLSEEDRRQITTDAHTLYEAAKRRAISGYMGPDQVDAVWKVWDASTNAVRAHREELPA